MGKWISAATCAATVLSLSVTLAAAQTATPPPAGTGSSQSKSAVKPLAKAVPNATIAGCVVRDAANAGQPTITSNGISYRLMGKSAADLDQYLGKRVEVTGALTMGAPDARATSGKADDRPTIGDSSTPKDLTATGGQSDIPATGATRDNTVPADPSTEVIVPGGTVHQVEPEVPLATDRGTTADSTGRVEIKTVRVISPNCL